jgi:RecA-family ATPase
MLKFDRMIAEVGAKLAVLDTAPDFFGGEEISRRQVAQFIRRLDAVSMTRGCALLFSAHPSVRGMASGEMDSGTTGWGAKVRARLSLHDPGEPDADEAKDGRGRRTTPVSTDHRVLTRHKSNYARQGETIDLVCRNGVFTTAALDPERAAARQRGPGRDAAAEAKFLDLLPMAEQAAGYIHSSANAHGHYAPAVFAARKDGGGFSKAEFTRAMQRLLEAGRLRQQPFGPQVASDGDDRGEDRAEGDSHVGIQPAGQRHAAAGRSEARDDQGHQPGTEDIGERGRGAKAGGDCRREHENARADRRVDYARRQRADT